MRLDHLRPLRQECASKSLGLSVFVWWQEFSLLIHWHLKQWKGERIHVWMNECMHGRTNERTNEWLPCCCKIIISNDMNLPGAVVRRRRRATVRDFPTQMARSFRRSLVFFSRFACLFSAALRADSWLQVAVGNEIQNIKIELWEAWWKKWGLSAASYLDHTWIYLYILLKFYFLHLVLTWLPHVRSPFFGHGNFAIHLNGRLIAILSLQFQPWYGPFPPLGYGSTTPNITESKLEYPTKKPLDVLLVISHKYWKSSWVRHQTDDHFSAAVFMLISSWEHDCLCYT